MVERAALSPYDALRAAVESPSLGSQGAMARLLGVSQPSVWKWLNRARRLPPEHVLAVEKATGVSKHDLRPDIYPRDLTAAGDGRFEHVR